MTDPGQRTHPLSPLVSSWIGLVGIAFFVGRDIIEQGGQLPDVRGWGIIAIIGVPVLLVVIGLAFVDWYFTRYRLDEAGLTLEKRFIVHQNTQVLYRRIQSVEIHQPLAARFLGLCRLHIDVGGEGGQKLSYLTRHDAENLRHVLLARAVEAKRTAAGEQLPPPQQPPAATPTTAGFLRHEIMHGGDDLADHEAPRRLVVQVPPRRLVGAAFTSGEFFGTLVGLAIFLGLRQLTGDSFELNIGFALVVLVPIGTYVLNRVVKEWRFRVETDGHGLRVSHGLTDLSTSNVPFDRVHGFRFEQSMLWRPFGWWRVRMTVLGKAGLDEDDSSDVALAIGSWDEAMLVVNEIWPGVDIAAVPLHPVPERAKWFLWWARKGHGWALTDDLAISRTGRLARRVNVADHSRAQAVTAHQGPLDRRLRLATIDIDMVSGPVSLLVKHLDEADARRLVEVQPGLARAVRERRALTGRTLSTRPAHEPQQSSMTPDQFTHGAVTPGSHLP
ncbi:PH domain-containing protein [Propionibacteriaceae bacterium G1746]|uniref:PH domain-containing protein n=1 Tax=Aestuariimicrobium sp. G57 TaxID=3418485 RepID=UPI003C174A3B